MKNNPVVSLALGTIKKDLKAHIMTFFIMTLSFTFLFGGYYLLHGDTIIRNEKTIETFGKWSYCFEDLTKNDIAEIKNHRSYENMVQVEETLSYTYQENTYYAANVNTQFLDMSFISLKQGHYPKNQNEIVVTEGLPYTLNETISINHQNYQVVGIINGYNQQWVEKAFDILTYQLLAIHQRTYVEAKENHDSYVNETENHKCIENVYRTRSSYSTTSEMNVFLAFIGIGIFIACFYDIDKTNERILLLKSIGMSTKQTHWYFALETLFIELITILISIPVGILSSQCIKFFYYQETGYHLATIDYLGTFKYYLAFILLTIFCIWAAIVYLEFKSYDGLITKKTHTKLKKYHKSYSMNPMRIGNRILKKNNYYVVVVVLLIVILRLMSSLSLENNDSDYYRQYGSCTFTYFVSLKEKESDFLSSLDKDLIVNEENQENYISFDNCSINNQELFPISTYDTTKNYTLLKGHDIQNNHECIATSSLQIVNEDNDEDFYQVQLGDHIRVSQSDEHEPVMYTVVGIMDEGTEGDIYINNQQDWTWTHNYMFETDNQDILFQLMSNSHISTLEKQLGSNVVVYQTSIRQLQSIKLLVMLVAMMIMTSILYLFIKKLFKELNLFRCLGMTNQQVIQSLIFMLMKTMVIVLFYSYLCGMRFDSWISIVFVMILLLIPGSIMSYFSLKGDVHYTPSDVERFY